MLRFNEALKKLFDVPRLVFALEGEPRSAAVVRAIIAWATTGKKFVLAESANGVSVLRSPDGRVIECAFLADHEAVRARFEAGLSPRSAVAVFDSAGMGRKRWSPTTHARSDASKDFPFWTMGAQWGVAVGEYCALPYQNRIDSCAKQLLADFVLNFEERLGVSWFPWGPPRKHEVPPVDLELPAHTSSVIAALNTGPNLRDAIADQRFAIELPRDAKISWLRVPPDPLECDEAALRQIMHAFRRLEETSRTLLQSDPQVRVLLMAGVDLDPRFHDLYLYPPQTSFSVRRPDLHWTGVGVFASENDEMPGGFPELTHVDASYGLNQDRWTRCFQWLTAQGPLLFLVSHEWSKCYVPEMRWLVERLVAQGYPARILTTDRLDELAIRADGVYHNNVRLGTIWRQFPIFELNDELAAIVTASHQGLVRMVPEFAYYGNKVLFSVYRSHRAFFVGALEPDVVATLDAVLPDSRLVLGPGSFPCKVGSHYVASIEELRDFPEAVRDGLVLKICGANPLAARSKGVLMGKGIAVAEWKAWLDERLALRQPFLLQQRIQTAIARIPVQHTGRNCPELFNCRVLVRPWEVGGEIVSASGCAVPSNTERVHGRVDMAIAAIRFV